MMKSSHWSLWLVYLLVTPLWAQPDASASLHWQSGSTQNVLIELYTSEGCSSCPPAERWLNAYQQHPLLWQRYFPVAFHVDYWNDLGWIDRFSRKAYSERQRRYARAGGVRTIYTPAFVVNGKAWRPRFFRRSDPNLQARETGKLDWQLTGRQWRASFASKQRYTAKLILHMAILGMDLDSKIHAGENRGLEAHHDFVVLHYQTWPANDVYWHGTLPRIDQTSLRLNHSTQMAAVIWISHAEHPAPLQVVGGYLPPGAIIKSDQTDH